MAKKRTTVMELEKQYVDETQKMSSYSLWEEGHALFNKRKYDEALEFFDRAIEMNPEMARAYLTTISNRACEEVTTAYWKLGDHLWTAYDERW